MNVHTPDRRTMHAALELACRAPSVHNTQPWRWRIADHSVHLYADESRLLPATDPTGRELVISCGAALHHARVAFASVGWRTDVHRLPNPGQPLHLASIEFARPGSVPDDVVALASAIASRHTDRRPFLPAPVPDAVLDRLETAAILNDAMLTAVDTEPALRELVVAMSQINELQRDDTGYRSELAVWAGRRLGAVDGVPASALRGVDAASRPVLGRDFSPAGRGDLAVPPIDDGALLAVLSTMVDDRHSWLCAGEALSAVLLVATAAGLASCTLSQVGEVPMIRDVIRTAVLDGDGEPQLLLRLGWPVTTSYPAPLSPRRRLAEVVDRLPLD
jgi:nitroreductase